MGPGRGSAAARTGLRTPTLRALLFATGLALVDLAIGWIVGYPFGGPVIGVSGGLGLALFPLLSPGFLLPAAAQTAAWVAWRWLGGERFFAFLGIGQAALLVLSPSVSPSSAWATTSALVGAGIMIVAFAAILQWIYRHKQLASSESQYLIVWAVGATGLGAGWLAWHLAGVGWPLVVATLLQVGLTWAAILRARPSDTEERIPWLVRPFWTFQLLLFIFLAEFFAGALLDLVIAGPAFLGYIPFLPYPSSGLPLVAAAAYDGLWFSASIMASAWFLLAVGVTMGSLLVLRIRETRERAQRWRMGLTLAVYALAAVYLPSFASSTPLATVPSLQNIPVLGWGFGLRAGGPFESGVFLAVLIMYAAVGVLTVLFGRKALCSVMCGAALMYQGTAINQMRQFNQTSKVGRYFLGSQLSTAYMVASSLALVSLFGVSLLSYLHSLPTVQVANGLNDTSALPLPIELYFGGLWFVMFVSTPYIGTYNCATTGFCHWGALSIPFARVGFFRLKVKDRRICQDCTTFDCAKACPVGLVDMPEHFRTKGEYRSTKCCGVGDCVGACPYGNLFDQDVRFWIRRRLARRAPAKMGSGLPMIQSATSSAKRQASAASTRAQADRAAP